MKLDSVNGNSYVFTVQNGQQSSITIRQRTNGPSIYGAIRTDGGVYNVESCDKDGGCNVVTYTKNSFFVEQENPNDAIDSERSGNSRLKEKEMFYTQKVYTTIIK